MHANFVTFSPSDWTSATSGSKLGALNTKILQDSNTKNVKSYFYCVGNVKLPLNCGVGGSACPSIAHQPLQLATPGRVCRCRREEVVTERVVSKSGLEIKCRRGENQIVRKRKKQRKT